MPDQTPANVLKTARLQGLQNANRPANLLPNHPRENPLGILVARTIIMPLVLMVGLPMAPMGGQALAPALVQIPGQIRAMV